MATLSYQKLYRTIIANFLPVEVRPPLQLFNLAYPPEAQLKLMKSQTDKSFDILPIPTGWEQPHRGLLMKTFRHFHFRGL